MRKHPFIRFFSLAILYAVVIIGIFVLQFRKEAVIAKNIGDLHINLAQMPGTAGQLKNQLQASFKGLSFSASERTPITVRSAEDDETHALVLESWEQADDNTARFHFTDGTALTFSVTGDSDDAALSITANPAQAYRSISLPYTVASRHTTEQLSGSQLLISSKDEQHTLTAATVQNGQLVLSADRPTALYAAYTPAKAFEYSDVADNELTSEAAYTATLGKVRDQIVTRFAQARTNVATLTEDEVTAYVAEMAYRNRYNEAILQIPAAFRQSAKRTYRSAPFLDNLANMNASLTAQTTNLAAASRAAIANKDIQIFSAEGLADYVLQERKNTQMADLLSFPATMPAFAPTARQAADMLALYAKVYPLDSALASKLDPVLDRCLSAIERQLHYEDDTLSLSNDEPTEGDEAGAEMDIMNQIAIGEALNDYGRLKNRSDCRNVGRLIINQALQDSESVDFATLATAYPRLVNNAYYPHCEILGYYGTRPVWAWTCSPSISYKIATNGVVNLTIDFLQGAAHYLIINGVPTFHSQIEIKRTRYRSAASFESYNASGYTYNENTQILFLKSLHATRSELIRLFCDPVTTFIGPDDSVAMMEEELGTLGIANVTVTRSEEGLKLAMSIQFESDSAVMLPTEPAKLQQIAQILNSPAYRNNDIMVAGHTASSTIGRPAQEVSEERAVAVAEYLIQMGVRTRDHIQMHGYGDTQPIAPNDTEENKARNRRVEIIILNK